MKARFPRDVVALVALVALGVIGRLLPHAPNFTPLAAIALFAGYFMSRRAAAIAVPLAAMAISDALIGTYDWRIMASVYLSLLVPIALRGVIGKKLSIVRIAGSALLSSIAFFAITNFAVWCFGTWYSHDLAGLSLCYAAGLPFFKYTAAGDLFWSTMLFGVYGLATRFVIPALVARRPAPITPAVSA